MRLTQSLFGLGVCLALAASQARADEVRPANPGPVTVDPATPNRILVPPGGCGTPGTIMPGTPGTIIPGSPGTPGAPGTPGTPGTVGEGTTPSPAGSDAASGRAFASAGEAGGAASESANPTMFGDLIGINGHRSVRVGHNQSAVVFIPVNSHTAFKISENESPRPLDRVFINYNFFDRVNASINGPGAPGVNVDVETIGFEKTFMDGNASIGMRLPFVQLDTASDARQSEVGDLTMVLKYAFLNDHETGNVMSAGLAITVPTGPSFAIPGQSDINDMLFQPFVGYVFNINRDLYVHGFEAVVVPTDARDVSLIFSDIGVGYFVYRSQDDSFLTSVVPTFEIHVNTPLNHRGAANSPVGFPDVVDLTSGVHLQFHKHCTFGAAVGLPVTGPRPFNFEGLAQLNIAF